MKKITLFLFLLFSTLCEAQVLASQNFDTALGWTSSATGWARRTTGGAPACATFAGAGMARFNSYDLASGSNARLTSPSIAFAGANYRVKFKMFRDDGYPTDADNVKVYYNTVASPAGAILLGTVNRSITLAPVVSVNGWYSYAFNVPAGTTGAGFIYFLGTGAYGNNIFIDEVVIDTVPSDDAEVNSIAINSIVEVGSVSVTGLLKNNGATPITSLDLNWQLDSGAVNTETLSGLTISNGASYTYTHTNLWTATPGEYALKVWVSNINGGAVDADITNDQLIKNISVASQSVARFPLYEKFSSATCPPCATFNGTYFTPFYNAGANKDNFALIDYQVNWPGAGDPYYTAEVGTRVQYYSINAAPTLLIDSKPATNFNTAQLQTDLNGAVTKPAYFAVSATKSLFGSDMTVDVTTTPYLSGLYNLQVAVVEKVTTGNVATNGETSFKNVMMKMLPNASGTSINFVNGVPVTTNLTATLDGLFIEELEDLEVIVFIQRVADKSIMQTSVAVDASLVTANFDTNLKVKLYPNPSTGIVKIATNNSVSITLTDVTGKIVFSASEITSDSQLNLSNLQKGVYFAKINDGASEQIQKVILK